MTTVHVDADEQWPILVVSDESYGDTVDIPAPLLAKFRLAEERYERATEVVLEHLRSTGQGSTRFRSAFDLDWVASR